MPRKQATGPSPPQSRGRGARTKLTPELLAQAVELIEQGNYAIVACRCLGISEETWYRWLREGERSAEGIQRQFYEAIRTAEAVAEQRAVDHWRRAFPEDWKACRDYLERKHPDRWAKKADPLINVDQDSGGVQIIIQGQPPVREEPEDGADD